MTWRHWILGAAFIAAPAFAEPQFKVPFDFEVNGTQWSAGTYEVNLLSSGFARIRNLDTHQGQFVIGNPDQSLTKDGLGSLKFNKYGDRYFLSQISIGDVGRTLQQSPKERALASASSRTVALIRTHPK
jgi:hypothetical protein